MTERYLSLHDVIVTVIGQFRGAPDLLDSGELAFVRNISETLGLFEELSRQLCSRDMTLAKADKLSELFMKLIEDKAHTNVIAQGLYEELDTRMNARRNQELYGLARYLESGGNYEQITSESPLS